MPLYFYHIARKYPRKNTSKNTIPINGYPFINKYTSTRCFAPSMISSFSSKSSQISITMGCGFRCFCWIYCIIYTLMFMFILSIIIFWIIISPSSVKFHVTEASLMQFNLTNNNTLYYKFKVNITARNPNNNIIVYYRKITAIAWYKDNDFAYVNLALFDQGHKNTTFLEPAVFEGNSVIKLGAKQLAEYKEETSVGIYNDLAVDLDVRIRAKYGRFKSSRFNPPIVQCRRLRVPLISNGTSAPPPPFNVTRCSSGQFFRDRDADAGA